jgi:hypothetical protein
MLTLFNLSYILHFISILSLFLYTFIELEFMYEFC